MLVQKINDLLVKRGTKKSMLVFIMEKLLSVVNFLWRIWTVLGRRRSQ